MLQHPVLSARLPIETRQIQGTGCSASIAGGTDQSAVHTGNHHSSGNDHPIDQGREGQPQKEASQTDNGRDEFQRYTGVLPLQRIEPLFRHETLILKGALPLQFVQGVSTRENQAIHGELVRNEVGIEEVNGKDEEGCQEGLLGMNDRRHIQNPPGYDPGRPLRLPEQKAGAADGKHPPEDRPEVELFPVGPAVEAGLRPSIEEPQEHPFHVFPVLLPRKQGIRAEKTFFPSPLALSPGEEEAAGQNEDIGHDQHQDPRGDAVPEPSRFSASPQADKGPGPVGGMIFQGETRRYKGEKGQNQKEMQTPFREREPLDVLIAFRSYFAYLRKEAALFPGMLFPITFSPPESCVDPEKGEREDQEAGHEDKGPVEGGISFLVPIVRMGLVFHESWMKSLMAAPAVLDEMAGMDAGTGVCFRQDVVSPVAVGAPGDQCGLADTADLAVVSLFVQPDHVRG